MPVEGTVHYDKTLTNLSVRFLEDDFEGNLIGFTACPLVNVDEHSARYPVFGMDEFKYDEDDDVLSDEGEANIYAPSMSADTYFCTAHAEKIIIPEYQRARADKPFEVLVVRRIPELARRMRRRHELGVAKKLMTAGNYATNNQYDLDASGTRWDEADPTPCENVELWMDSCELQCAVRPDTIIFPRQVWRKFHNLPEVKAAIRGDKGGAVRRPDVAEYFGLRNVLIGGGMRDTAAKGKAASLARVWNYKHVALLYVGQAQLSLETPSTAKTLVWNPDGIPVSEKGMVVGMGKIDWRGGVPGSQVGEVDWHRDIKLTGVNEGGKIISGYLAKNVIG